MQQNATPGRPQQLVGRFAPSPTGRMHAGNIYAALVAWIVAKRSGGYMVLRIEDLDPERSKSEFIDAVQRDFAYLGLTWDRGPFFQSTRSDVYADAFNDLQAKGITYPCFCTRADLHAASAPHRGEKPVYPGTCRHLSPEERSARIQALYGQGRAPSTRLIVPEETIVFDDYFQGRYEQNLATECGDFLIRRSDGAFAYQLAVVIDDAEQGVTSIVRGIDLLCSTPQQIYLQGLLHALKPVSSVQVVEPSRISPSAQPAQPILPTPAYGHIPLLVTEQDRRLSKRDHDAGIDALKHTFGSAAGILGHIAYVAGLIPEDAPATADELLACANLDTLRHKVQIPWF